MGGEGEGDSDDLRWLRHVVFDKRAGESILKRAKPKPNDVPQRLFTLLLHFKKIIEKKIKKSKRHEIS